MSVRDLARLATVLTAGLLVVAALIGPGATQAEAASLAPGTNCYRIPTTQKVVALTFDDWYSGSNLKIILATLKATGVDATFFEGGEWVASRPDLVRSIVAAGHDIGSHSYSHPDMTTLSEAGIRSEIRKTEQALTAAGVMDPAPLFRVPFGTSNSRLLSVLRSEGYANIMWTCGGTDVLPGWTATRVVNSVLYRLGPGAIILLHVRSPLTATALLEVIRQVKARGYRFVNLKDALFSPDQTLARYQQNSPLLSYAGSWSKWTSSLDSGGSFYYSTSKRSAIMASFTGTTLELLCATGPNYGKALVTIDGGAAREVDLYSSGYQHRRMVFNTEGLVDTTHTLLITCSGTKNPASTGYSINLDAVRVAGVLTEDAPTPRYQQEDPHFTYMGRWSTNYTWSASGGSFAATDSPGSAVSIAFDGTYLGWAAKKGPGYGKAWVSLDGGAPALVDLYSAYDTYKQRVYNTGFLEEGPHTLSIYWIGQKNAASSGYKVDVDAFDILGTVTTATAPKPILWRYQQNDVRLTYLGSWSTGTSTSASMGSFSSSDDKGAAVLVDVTGTSVQVIARKAPWYGKASVSLDGGTAQVVDLYSASTRYSQSVYNKTGLASGAHTLTIKRLGQKNSAATGYAISLDALPITGSLTQAAKTTVYQQDYAKVRYAGTWAKASNASASGGTYVSANTSGAKITLTFTGTYLTWFAKTAPWYGKAKVTLDGGSPVTVDLYSPAEAYKKQVYNAGLLADKSHTLVIQWTGTKRTGASGTAISADAFGVLGSLY